MNRYCKILCFLFFTSCVVFSQLTKKDIERKDMENRMDKTAGITERAAGIHNAGNIGLFFENRGKLYPRRLSQGPSGEYPINSAHNYIYRINPFFGVPGNVVQGRYTTNEEWEAVGGYHNKAYSLIAFSDNPGTWDPKNGWPVKDVLGNPVIKSDQDSYCVYSDTNNTKSILGLVVAQTGYTYGLSFAKNILFYKFQVTSASSELDNVYFSLYTDIDVGDASGGANEYQDDMLGFDKSRNFVYFYDSKGYSKDWQANAGYFGIIMLKTPAVNGKEPGITDMHYNLYDDDLDIDTVQFGIMSSSQTLYNSALGKKYFHLGTNPNIHFDDPATIPAAGLDILANISSGPYKLKKGDTLTFITAILVGENLQEITNTADQAKKILDFDFELAKPPAAPVVSGFSGSGRASIYWNDKSESSFDKFTSMYDFEGYRLYRSMDKGLNWDKLADFDVPNKVGLNSGLQYAYIDSTITNGFEYWYSLTSYDRGDSSLASLETSKGSLATLKNIYSSIPRSNALGRQPVSVTELQHTGKSNYPIDIKVNDADSLANNTYKIGFTYSSRVESGKLRTRATYTVSDSLKTKPYRYGILFRTPTMFDLVNLTTGESVKEEISYRTGGVYTADGIKIKLEDPDPKATEYLPKTGDYLSVNFAVCCVKNQKDTIIYPRTFLFNKLQSTSDGIIFSIKEPEANAVLPTLQDSYSFKIKGSSVDKSMVDQGLNKIRVVPNPYVVSSLYEPEYGELRKEPLRQIQFTNLPPECTIYIFSVTADLVKTIYHNSMSGTESWDLKAEGKREVAPGMYIYVVDAKGTKYKSRFAIIK